MTEFTTITGEIFTVGTIVQSVVALKNVAGGHFNEGVIEAFNDAAGDMVASARVRDWNGRVRNIPVVNLRLHPKYPFSVVLPKEMRNV